MKRKRKPIVAWMVFTKYGEARCAIGNSPFMGVFFSKVEAQIHMIQERGDYISRVRITGVK